MSVKYEGIIPPIVTPFTASGEIDEEKIRREMEICLDAGADGISVGGSTGEGPTLRDEELTQLIKIAREYVKEGSDKTVVCGIMRTCTRDAVRAGKTAKEAGADAIMVTPTDIMSWYQMQKVCLIFIIQFLKKFNFQQLFIM